MKDVNSICILFKVHTASDTV